MAKTNRGRSEAGTALSTKARSLSRVLKELGVTLPHTKSLEAVARLDGMANRHAAIAAAAAGHAGTEPKPTTGPDDAAAIAAVLRKATSYANAGRDFPLSGIGNLFDVIEDARQEAAKPPVAGRKRAKAPERPKQTAVGEATLRTTGDSAVVAIGTYRLEIKRQRDHLTYELTDKNGFVVDDPNEDALIQGFFQLDEATYAIYGDDAEDLFKAADEPHDGTDRIELVPDESGTALVRLFGLLVVQIDTSTLDDRHTLEVQVLYDERWEDVTGTGPEIETLVDTTVRIYHDPKEERFDNARRALEAYDFGTSLVEARSMFDGDGDQLGCTLALAPKAAAEPGTATRPSKAHFVVRFSGPETAYVVDAYAIDADGKVFGKPGNRDAVPSAASIAEETLTRERIATMDGHLESRDHGEIHVDTHQDWSRSEKDAISGRVMLSQDFRGKGQATFTVEFEPGSTTVARSYYVVPTEDGRSCEAYGTQIG